MIVEVSGEGEYYREQYMSEMSKRILIPIGVLLVIVIVIYLFFVPCVSATGTVVKETHSSGNVILNDPKDPTDDKTEINQIATIEYTTWYGKNMEIDFHNKYEENFPYYMPKGTVVEINYCILNPSRIKIVKVK